MPTSGDGRSVARLKQVQTMKKIAIPSGMNTCCFVMSSGALDDLPQVLREEFSPDLTPWIVADENTWDAAGQRVAEILRASGSVLLSPRVFPAAPRLHATSELADELAAAMPGNALPLAVGSGTVNDLVKRASGLRQKRYCCIPTACSVDGYTSSGAALTRGGFKQTLPCPPPFAVVADLAVLKTAPAEMLASGYADLAAKLPAGADWIIVDELGLEPINSAVWQLVQQDLKTWLADHNNLEHIFMGLAATGYAMQLYHESRPASGAEHLFSHIWEMEGLEYKGEPVSHGFKVGVGTLASTLLQEFVINTPVSRARRLAEATPDKVWREAEIDRLLCRGVYGNAKEVAMSKFLTGSAITDRRDLIFNHWENLRTRLSDQVIGFDRLKQQLAAAGCPTEPAAIGLTPEQFRHGIEAAQLIRRRYTILDLLYETGLLNTAMNSLDRMIS